MERTHDLKILSLKLRPEAWYCPKKKFGFRFWEAGRCVSGETDMVVTSLELLGFDAWPLDHLRNRTPNPQYHTVISIWNSLACSSFAKTFTF